MIQQNQSPCRTLSHPMTHDRLPYSANRVFLIICIDSGRVVDLDPNENVKAAAGTDPPPLSDIGVF